MCMEDSSSFPSSATQPPNPTPDNTKHSDGIISVGDGYVELLDHMGSDLTVVHAARVSFNKHSPVFDHDKDARLIRYLANHNHSSPFFHPQIQLRIKMPIYVAREWFRHTIGFARNEMSRRYVDSSPEVWMCTDFRARDPRAKQGSRFENVDDDATAKAARIQAETVAAALDAYTKLLDLDVAPEIARSVLPQGTYTEFWETGSLHAYARLCKLRLDPHAQREIRDYAEAVNTIMKGLFPVSWSALFAAHPQP